MSLGTPLPHVIFTDNHRRGDLHEWNRAALGQHDAGGVHRIEREGFQPFWAVIDHGAVLDSERQHELLTNRPEPVLQAARAIAERTLEIRSLIHIDGPGGHGMSPIRHRPSDT